MAQIMKTKKSLKTKKYALLFILFSPPQEHGHGHSHSHFHGSECYLSANGDAEGVREKLQANGEALGDKADAGEGELMLSPAQTPQVWQQGLGVGIALCI